MSLSRVASKCVWTLVCVVSLPLVAAAQTPDAGVAERLSKLEGATAAAQTGATTHGCWSARRSSC